MVLRHPASVVSEILGGLEQAQSAGVNLRGVHLVDQAGENAEPKRTANADQGS